LGDEAIPVDAVTGEGTVVSPDPAVGRMMVSTMLGSPVIDRDGHPIGHVVDLVVDLGADLDRVPGDEGSRRPPRRGPRGRPLDGAASADRRAGFVLEGSADTPETLEPSEILVRRDILDAPVVLADPPKRARVSDVVLEVDAKGAWVIELDVSTAGAIRRLLGRPPSVVAIEPVRLSAVHLASSAGHRAQLTVPAAPVFPLEPNGLANVLTRVSVAHARDILRFGDRGVVEQALGLLHAHVRSRVTGDAPPPCRMRRLAGWRLPRPDAGSRTGAAE
jgi:hypothetical protein